MSKIQIPELTTAALTSEDLREQLLTELAEMRRLHELSTLLLRADELVALLRDVLMASIELLAADKGHIQLYDEAGGVLRMITHVGLSPDFVKQFGEIPLGLGCCGRAMERRERVIVEDVFKEADYECLRPFFVSEGLVAVQSTPLFGSDGRVLGMLSTQFRQAHRPSERKLRLLDLYARHAERVIERKQMEDELRQRREDERVRRVELETLMEAVPAIVWVADDPECRRITGNRAGYEFLRLAPGQNLSITAPAPERPRHFHVFKDGRLLADDELPMQVVARTGKPLEGFEIEVRFSDGTSSWLFGSVVPLRRTDGGVRGVLATLLDITTRRRAEEALRENEQRLRIAHEAARWGVFDFSYESGRFYWSPEIQALYGLGPGEFAGTYEEWQSRLHPADRPAAEAAIARSVETGEYLGEFRVVWPDQSVHWLFARARMFCDELGKPIRLLGVNVDITERKQAAEALATAQEALRVHAGNLEQQVKERTGELTDLVGELESFSYSLTHDLREPLRAMQGFAHLLEVECAGQLNDDGREYISRIVTAAYRMDRLVQDALNYSVIARKDLELTSVNLEEFLRGILETYPSFQLPQADIQIEGRFPPVLANEAAFTQCVSNLLGNAIKFVAKGQMPRVRIRAESRPDRVRLLVCDNGVGIAPEFHGRIFEIFQRLNRDYEGTGIGLAIVKKAVERMGGSVGVESAPGQGSTFWIELKPAPGDPAR